MKNDKKFELNLIVAVANKTEKGYPIGVNGRMPWECKEDLAWFKEVTMGYPIIMGRKTYESIGRVLPGRKNIVVSKTMDICTDSAVYDNLVFAHSIEDAIKIAKEKHEKAFIIGGGSIYNYVLDNKLIDNIYLDEIDLNLSDADTFFPDFNNKGEWKQLGRRIEIARGFAYSSVWEHNKLNDKRY